MKKWTLEEVEQALRTNVKDYGSAIAVAGLFKKIYGRFPSIGLSGAQAEMADLLVDKLPTPEESLEVNKGEKK